jgi:hypothetical protein
MREFKDSISAKSNESEDDKPQIEASGPPPADSEPAQPAGVSAPAEPSRSEGAAEPRP